MDRFSWEKGLCHFVFANEDMYFLKSLVRLNLRQYLYVQLKKKQYKAVYFISGEEGRYQVEFGDNRSEELYEKYRKQGILNFFRIKEEEHIFSFKNMELFFNQVLEMMKREKNMAFVFEIQMFAEVSSYPELISEIIKQSEKNYGREHLFLIHAPTAAEGSKRYLADPSGIFQSDLFPLISEIIKQSEKNYGREHLFLIHAPTAAEGSKRYLADPSGIFQSDLFPKIQRIFRKQNVPIYEKMVDEMENRISFLNDWNRGEIISMLRFLLMGNRQYFQNYLGMEEIYADIILAWYRNEQFRRDYPLGLPENKRYVRKVVYESLLDEHIFSKLHALAKQWYAKLGTKEKVREWIEKTYPSDNMFCFIYEENSLAKKTDKLLKTGMLGERLFTDTEKHLLMKIRQELLKPRMLLEDETAVTYIDQCIEYVQNACVSGNKTLLDKSLEGIEYRFSSRCENNLKDRDYVMKLYMDMLQLIKKEWEMEEQIDRDSRKIDEYGILLKEKIRDIHRFESEHPDLMEDALQAGKITSGDQHLLAAKKTEAVGIKRSIRNMEYVRASQKETVSKCREYIHKMEIAVNLTEGRMEPLLENTNYINQLITDAVWSHTQFMNKIEQEDRETQDRMEEMIEQHQLSLDGRESVDLEYEELLQESLEWML